MTDRGADVDADINFDADADADADADTDMEMVAPSWSHLRSLSTISRFAWRDVVIKLHTREHRYPKGDIVSVAPCAADGGRTAQALKQLHEGLVLRVLYVLCVLYPLTIWRESELRFRVCPIGAPFVHMMRQLSLAAFGCCRLNDGRIPATYSTD